MMLCKRNVNGIIDRNWQSIDPCAHNYQVQLVFFFWAERVLLNFVGTVTNNLFSLLLFRGTKGLIITSHMKIA